MTPSDPGTVFWITGLSGAGKSTVAARLQARLRGIGRPAMLIDGDRMRAILGAQALGGDDRRRLGGIYAALARDVALQGLDAICATMSLFHDLHAWNRANIRHYREIYLRTHLATRRARDPKGLYRAADAGIAGGMPGLDEAFEAPRAPDLVIDNDTDDPETAVALIWDRFVTPAQAAA
jgi:adenylylsulfate kinase-like enzyme